MSVETIRVVLGRLQEDPESASAWDELTEIVTTPSAASTSEIERLLEQARARHAERREWAAVASMLDLELSLHPGAPDESMVAELARIYDEELADSVKAVETYKRLTAANDPALKEKAESFLETEEGKRAKWSELCDRYLAEAHTATDASFRSVLFASAADVAYRYAGEAISREALLEYVETALELDAKNRRAALLAEIIYTKLGDQRAVARVLSRLLAVGASREDRVSAGLRVGRIYDKVLGEKDLAVDAYQQVLDMVPGQPDALSYLAEAFSRDEAWDHLVALYEDQLKGGLKGEAELGVLLQIAMVHWRMRDKPEAAEPYFDRVRRADPTHGGMLAFFRTAFMKRGDSARLVSILTDAQRSTSDPALKKELAKEIAGLAESTDNAQKAIEQYRSLLKSDPTNDEAKAALFRLYNQTNNFAAVVDLLRQDLDRAPVDDAATRAGILREIATIHRDKQKNEQALVATLVQITHVDESDAEALRELVAIYEHLGRFRDLLLCQQKLADLTTDEDEKAELYRSAARRWGEQFSNVQNAITAYEGLLGVRPRDEEARSKLRELYTKRRSWAQLYSLYEIESKDAEGAVLTELLGEMAKLAAERLDRGADAIALQKRILENDPSNAAVFDALEKQAEREKDFATLAEVLETRVDATNDEAQKLQLLQKLGVVYETRLKDPSATARTWKRVLDLQPGHQKALRVLRESYLASGELDSLESLYEAQGDWENLADFLSSAADKAAPAQKVTISFRAARVYEERLKAKERAARSYERVLSVDASNHDAAFALVPLYEKEERWARLPALYEILLAAADDKSDRVAILKKLATVMGGPLADKNAALAYARRAYELAADTDTLELLESWSRAASSWGPFVEAVQVRLKNKEGLDPVLERQLKVKLADAYARELGKIDEAALVYKDLVTHDPSDAETIRTFDALLRGAERKDDLRWLFEMRVSNAEPHDRAEIYEEWATLEEDVFGNAKDAIGLYRKAIEIEPERNDALRALSRLLLAAEDFAGATEIIARHRDVSNGESRAQREIELADLYFTQLARPDAAFEAAVRALELKPHDPDAVSILSKLLDVSGLPGAPAKETVRARAASVLELEYRELGDAQREGRVLAILMESEDDPVRRLDLHIKLAEVEERLLSAPGTAFSTILRALNEFPDEIGLWDRASELGMKAGRPTDLAEAYRAHIIAVDSEAERRISRDVEQLLCERAATLHDEQLGDADGAMPYLKRILVMDPGSDRAFERLKQILTASERWSELEELFEQAAQTATDQAQKISLLGEVALVAEEIMGDSAKAIRYHERILAINPHHVPSLDTLEKLYEDEERFEELGVLLEKRLENAVDDEAVDIRLYLGRLYLERLASPERSVQKAEEILTARPEDPDARELAERLLEVEALRLRTARLLETVYEVKDDIKNLVKMLEIRLGAAKDDSERRDLLRRISELRDERLHDDAGAFASLADRLPLDPEDEGTRERFIEIGRKLGEHAKIAAVLTKTADATTAKPVRAEILMAVASLCEGPLEDPLRAEKEYRKVIETDSSDPSIVVPAAKALARIYEARGDNEALADIISTEVKLEESIETRKALYEKLGELYEKTLLDPSSAIDAYKLRLTDDSGDEHALTALERLYENAKDYRELVRILRAREEASSEQAERRRAMVKAAETLAGPLDDAPEAISAWRAVLDAFGPERATLAALAALYEKTSRYADLAETLEVDLSLAEEPADRIALLARLGDTRRVFLADLPSAIDAYRQALELDASDPKSRAALEALLEGGDGDAATIAQRSAAEILHPLYEAENENEKLLKVLEIEAVAADSPPERLDKLTKALATAEGPLADPARAYRLAQRAVKEAVGEDSITDHVKTLERLTETTGRFEETRKLYESIVSDVLDGDAQQDMLLRIGELATEKAKDPALAVEFYKRALEARADDKRALVALEGLYAEKPEDAKALLEVLRRRAEVAESDDERKELLFREAEIQKTSLEDVDGAITTLESVLEIDLDPRATSALETLYTARTRHTDLVALYERQLDTAPPSLTGRGSAASAIRVKIARLARGPLEDIARAFDELSAALDADPAHAEAIAELEAILHGAREGAAEPKVLEERARAGEMLEPVYLRHGDWTKVKGALTARIAACNDSGDKVELLRRLATLHEEQLEDYAAALATMAQVLHEDVSDQSVWSELERLARVASASKQLAGVFASELEAIADDDETTAKLARRTGEIFADLGDVTAALKWYRRVHSFEPESEELFDAIDALLQKEKRHEERVKLYRAALDYREGERRLSLLHSIADLEERELGRLEDAVDTYRAALDVDADDTTSLDRLTELYKKLERHQDLADLYLRRAESASSPEAAAPFRLALARLSKVTLGEKGTAIDQLEAIVTEVPWHTDAIAELEALSHEPEHKARVVEILRPLYERADDWKLLVKLNEDRIQLAEDPRDKATILRETARLWETRGSDTNKAFAATRKALEVDPGDAETRSEAERLAKAVSAFAELATTYEASVPRLTEDFEKRELLQSLARVYDSELDDPRRALETQDRLFALDENELDPLDKIDELAILLGDWPKVIQTLEKKVGHASDADGAALLRRIAQTKLDMVDDPDGAAEAYERALALEPDHTVTLDRLIEIYESLSPGALPDGRELDKTERLVELFARRVELATADEADLRYDLNMRAAKRQETSLGSRRDAIASLSAALETRPGDRAALLSLERLYRAEEMWHELLENLREQAGLAETTEQRTSIRVAIGNLHVDQLSSPEEALDEYRLVLAESPDDAEAARRAKKIAEEREELRLTAADILLPVLRAAGKHAERVEVLELKLTAESDPTERAATLKDIAGILDGELSQPQKAQEALLRALAETPEDDALHTEIERLAGPAAGSPEAEKAGFASYADALERKAQSLLDVVVAKGLFVRLGRIAEDKLDDAPRAVGAYTKAVEQAGDESELLGALDRLHEKLGSHKELADVIERRIAVSSEGDQAQLFYRLARLQIEKQREPVLGLGSLRSSLERDPTHAGARAALEELTDNSALFEEVAETLENVYRQSGDNAALARLYEKRIRFAPTKADRVRMRLDLSRVLEDRSSDAKAALGVLEGALEDEPGDSDVLAEIERLAAITDGWKGASEALEKAIRAHEDITGEQASDLWMRAAGWRKDKVKDLEGAEKDFVEALRHDEQNVVILRAIEEIQRAPGRERDLVETLRRIAKLEGSEAASGLRREAKGLSVVAGDDALTESILREMIAADEADAWALAELTQTREKAEDWKEVFALLARRAELAAGGDTVRELRREAATVARDKLSENESAIDLFEQIFEDLPTDDGAPVALRGLYTKTGRKKDLLKLLVRLVDVADSPSARSGLRIEAATVCDELDAQSEAIDHLRAALEEEPSHREATLMLSRLLEKTGRDEELAELLNAQIALAAERSDRDGELSYRVRLGEVYESRLGNVEKAIETYAGVLERDEKNLGALLSLARLHEKRGEKADAAKYLERTLEVAEPLQAVAHAKRLAQIFADLGDESGTRRALERGLALKGDDAELREKLRSTYEKLKAYPELAAHITEDARRTTETPDKVRLLRAAADIHTKQLSDASAAATLLAEASELVPTDRELLLTLCDAYSASGRAKQAVEALQKIVESFGGRRAKELAPIHHRLAKAYLAEGDRTKALAELDSAFKLDPGSIAVLRDLGVLSLELADAEPSQKDAYLDRAGKTFKALLMQKLDDGSAITKGEVFFYLGDTHRRQGDDKKAIQMLERALDTDKNLEKAKTLLAELKGG